jgi:hypothetical protein
MVAPSMNRFVGNYDRPNHIKLREQYALFKAKMAKHSRGGYFPSRHCEERKRRSNPEWHCSLDCFASFAMTN